MRICHAKVGKVRFTSHRDVARIWERVLRRAGVPVARTEGFSPRPKLHFGLALPTGAESLGELLDVDLAPEHSAGIDPDELGATVDAELPPGLCVRWVEPIERGGLSLQQAVVASGWWISAVGLDPPTVEARLEELLGAEEIPMRRERKGKAVTDDIRPYLEQVELDTEPVPATLALGPLAERVGIAAIEPPAGGVVLRATLRTQPRAVRPSELLAAISPDLESRRVVRVRQDVELDGDRVDLLQPAATRAPATVGAP